jgi:L-amino acid N-acyltransferase YncA
LEQILGISNSQRPRPEGQSFQNGELMRIDVHPSPATLQGLWQQFEADPLRSSLLADTSTFLSAQHFIAAVGHSILPFVAYVDEEPTGIAWLYDIAMVPPKMTPVSAFLAVYVLPLFRRQHIVRQHVAGLFDIMRGYGLAHLWAEVRSDNLPSQAMAIACGFEKVATLPTWKRYQGQWQDMYVYHLPLASIAETTT